MESVDSLHQSMTNESLCAACIGNMMRTVQILAARVPAPVFVDMHGHTHIRYKEKTIQQAVVLKLARLVSNLNAAQLLLNNGYVQEQGALQRMIDEGDEDITFLTLAIMSNDVTELHMQYLAAFWQEEFDQPTALESTQKRPSIPRKKINAWIARHPFSGIDESTGVALTNTIHKTYSGYVHGAAPHIMDLYGGTPPRFHMKGMLGTPRHEEHADDLLNYYYRAIAAFGLAAKAFGDEALFAKIYAYSRDFASRTGTD
jgi:hypothetical protein